MINERNLRHFRFSAYLKFLRGSTNHHGIHSPFVFGLVTRCFYNREQHPAYDLIAQHRKNWRGTTEKLRTDTAHKEIEPSYSDIRKVTVWKMDMKEARLLNRMIRYLKSRRILQLGEATGFKTAAMSVMNQVEILSVQPNPFTAELSQNFVGTRDISNVRVIVTEVEDKLKELVSKGLPDPFDLIFLDASIEDTTILQLFELLLPLTHNDTVLIVEGIHRSGKMEEVWKKICLKGEVRVSIDIFRWGLVFFRREQAKEHFKVRI